LFCRNLRERLKTESYEFVKQQRIECLVSGAWFPVIKDKGRVKNVYRFYRLGPNKKFLHYGDFSDMSERKPPLEVLNERSM
jgi:engulfment/cell motility protein 1